MLGEIRIGNRNRGDEGIFVGRPSIFGNEFRADELTRALALELYRNKIDRALQENTGALARAVNQLASRVASGEDLVLVCFCAPLKSCHAEVIRDAVMQIAKEIHDKE